MRASWKEGVAQGSCDMQTAARCGAYAAKAANRGPSRVPCVAGVQPHGFVARQAFVKHMKNRTLRFYAGPGRVWRAVWEPGRGAAAEPHRFVVARPQHRRAALRPRPARRPQAACNRPCYTPWTWAGLGPHTSLRQRAHVAGAPRADAALLEGLTPATQPARGAALPPHTLLAA